MARLLFRGARRARPLGTEHAGHRTAKLVPVIMLDRMRAKLEAGDGSSKRQCFARQTDSLERKVVASAEPCKPC